MIHPISWKREDVLNVNFRFQLGWIFFATWVDEMPICCVVFLHDWIYIIEACWYFITRFAWIWKRCTLAETDSSPLKINGKMKVLSGVACICRCKLVVSGRVHNMKSFVLGCSRSNQSYLTVEKLQKSWMTTWSTSRHRNSEVFDFCVAYSCSCLSW